MFRASTFENRSFMKDFSDYLHQTPPSTAWTTTETKLIELDILKDSDDKVSLYFDRIDNSYLIVRNPRLTTKQNGWETITYLAGVVEGRYEYAPDAFRKWLELVE